MACEVQVDPEGSLYIVPAAITGKTPGSLATRGVPELHAWWNRRFKDKSDETLVIKQENHPDRADVIEVTFGQLYDLIDALNKAVEAT